MKGLIVVLIACLGGCAPKARVEQSFTPSGKVGYSATCSTKALFGSAIEASWADCYAAAGKQCGVRGFVIVDRTENSGFDVYRGSGAATHTRAMIFTCNEART